MGHDLVAVPDFGSFAWLPSLDGFEGFDPTQALALHERWSGWARATRGPARNYLRFMAALAHEEFGRPEVSTAIAEELLAECGPAEGAVWRAAVLAMTVQHTLAVSWSRAALDRLAEAVELVDAHPQVRRDRALALMTIAAAMQAARAFEQAAAVLRTLLREDPGAAIHHASALVLLHLTAGAQDSLTAREDEAERHWVAALQMCQRWRRVAQEFGDQEQQDRATISEVHALSRLGLHDGARALAASADLARHLHPGQLEVCLLELHRGEEAAAQGRTEDARRHLTRAMANAQRADAGIWRATVQVTRARVEERAGEPEAAMASWRIIALTLLTRVADQQRSFDSELQARRAVRRMSAASAEASRAASADPLTGVGNRRALDEALARAHAQGTPLSACFIDVDEFKAVNDTWSHAVGDAVLRAIAQIATAACRGGDLVARYGGDEFVVLVDGDAARTASLAERVHRAVGAHPWELLAPGLGVTVSVGVAPSLPAAAVLAAADAAMLSAKRAGRDRVTTGTVTGG